MIHVVIIMWGGLIEDVKAFQDKTDAAEFFRKETDVPWEEFKRRIENEDSETILKDYAGSDIWDIDVQGKK